VGSDVKSPALARDGSRLVFTRSLHTNGIWRQALGGDGPGPAEPVLVSTRWDSNPQFSPDGRRIAFASTRSGSAEIWVSRADGTEPVRLTSFGGPHTGLPRWSADGKYLAFEARIEGQPDVFVLPVEGGSPRRLTDSPALDVAPSWSHDGRWVYFGSNRSLEWQVWKVPAEGGAAVQVTRNGGRIALESPDGTGLYFTRTDSAGIWRMPIAGGPPRKVVEGPGPAYPAGWSMTRAGLFFVNHATRPAQLGFFDFGSGQTTVVASYEHPAVWGDPGFSVSPDGRVLLFNRREYTSYDIMVADGVP
jgi:Tol biopolymer transport system component